MFYFYDKETSEIYTKSEKRPESDLYCTSGVDFDLTLYRVIVGAVSEDKQLAYYTQKARPAEQLAQIIRDQQAENDVLGQTIAGLSLQNMQLNATLDTLRETLAQAQLDIMTLKGGAV